MGQGAISIVVQAGKEPPAVFRVNKITFLAAYIGIPGNRPDFRAAIARSSLSRPDTNFPSVIKDQSIGASIFKDGVVIFILVELDTSVELGAILRMSIVSLPGAF